MKKLLFIVSLILLAGCSAPQKEPVAAAPSPVAAPAIAEPPKPVPPNPAGVQNTPLSPTATSQAPPDIETPYLRLKRSDIALMRSHAKNIFTGMRNVANAFRASETTGDMSYANKAVEDFKSVSSLIKSDCMRMLSDDSMPPPRFVDADVSFRRSVNALQGWVSELESAIVSMDDAGLKAASRKADTFQNSIERTATKFSNS